MVVRPAPWRDVLAVWWPRLLPGIAAGATYGVIRVGHAVRALLTEETGPRIDELGRGLAYWAARWQPIAPAGRGPYRSSDPRSALDAVPRIPDQRFGIRNRLAQLADLPGWAGAAAAVPGADTEPAAMPQPPAGIPRSAADVMQRAADDGDPHAIKFADTAVEAYAAAGDSELLVPPIMRRC